MEVIINGFDLFHCILSRILKSVETKWSPYCHSNTTANRTITVQRRIAKSYVAMQNRLRTLDAECGSPARVCSYAASAAKLWRADLKVGDDQGVDIFLRTWTLGSSCGHFES